MHPVLWPRTSHKTICVLHVTTLKCSVHDECHELLAALIPIESASATTFLQLQGGTKVLQATPWPYQWSRWKWKFFSAQLFPITRSQHSSWNSLPSLLSLAYSKILNLLWPSVSLWDSPWSFPNFLLCVLHGAHFSPNFDGRGNCVNIILRERKIVSWLETELKRGEKLCKIMDFVILLYDTVKLFCPQQLMIFLSTLVWSPFIHMTSSVWNILLFLCLANFFLVFKSAAFQFLYEAFLALPLSSTHSLLRQALILGPH